MSIALLLFGACDTYRYDDYITDFDYTAVYFPHQTLERSFVYGEFDHIQVAVQIGGRRENTTHESVTYEIDNEVTVEGAVRLPSDYYTLSNNSQFDIMPGDLGGELTLTVNQNFFDNVDETNYFIPFKLMSSSVDTILADKKTMVLMLQSEAAKFGHYYHNGKVVIDYVGGDTETVYYHQEEPVTNPENNWELATLNHQTLVTNGIANLKSGGVNYGFNLTVNTDNSVDLSANTDSDLAITANGTSTYNPSKKEFYLNYKYQDIEGNAHTVTDTLIFRNRILDGINQWNL